MRDSFPSLSHQGGGVGIPGGLGLALPGTEDRSGAGGSWEGGVLRLAALGSREDSSWGQLAPEPP